MEMKIDIELIKFQREKRAWTQSQLAQLSGLSLRTIQRIEKSGLASQESAKSIASVLEIPVERLQINQNRKLRMLSKWAASSAASFATGLSTMFLLSANAETVMIDLNLSKQEELVTNLHIFNESGSESVVEISELLTLKVVSELQNGNSIKLHTKLFDLSSGKEVLIGAPELIAQNREEVEIQFGDFSLSLTPSK